MSNLLPASLLGLPAELRNRIYQHVFSPTGSITDYGVFSSQGSHNLKPLLTCKRVYNEAQTLAFSLTIFITGQYYYDELYDRLSRLDDVQREAIQHVALATHLNPDFEASYNEWSFQSGMPPAITTFLWGTLDLLPGVKHIIIFNRGRGCNDLRGYLRNFAVQAYCKQLGTNPSGWDIIDAESLNRYRLKSHDSDRAVEIEYQMKFSGLEEGIGLIFRDAGDHYRAPEVRG